MAELLVRARSNGVDPMHYQPGDVVCVRPDGWPWSVAERDTSQFWLVLAPGEAAEPMERDLTRLAEDPDGNALRRRLERLEVPPQVVAQLTAGPVTLTRQQINALRRLTR